MINFHRPFFCIIISKKAHNHDYLNFSARTQHYIYCKSILSFRTNGVDGAHTLEGLQEVSSCCSAKNTKMYLVCIIISDPYSGRNLKFLNILAVHKQPLTHLACFSNAN